MKDVYRQAAIDLMFGEENTDELRALLSSDDATDGTDDSEEAVLVMEKEENMKTLIDECEYTKMCLLLYFIWVMYGRRIWSEECHW